MASPTQTPFFSHWTPYCTNKEKKREDFSLPLLWNEKKDWEGKEGEGEGEGRGFGYFEFSVSFISRFPPVQTWTSGEVHSIDQKPLVEDKG